MYAGKICAALSRQHPRDLFDIKILFETGAINDIMRQAFVVYLACNPRPIHEILSPNLLDIKLVFEKEFSRMTEMVIDYHELLSVRDKLISHINQILTIDERNFLISLKAGEPKYDLLLFDNLDRLPALQWKLINIKKLDRSKHRQLLNNLEVILSV